jgi:hypothetical protein
MWSNPNLISVSIFFEGDPPKGVLYEAKFRECQIYEDGQGGVPDGQ